MVSEGLEDEILLLSTMPGVKKGQLDFSKAICLRKTRFSTENVCLFVLKKARRQRVNCMVSPLDGATFNAINC